MAQRCICLALLCSQHSEVVPRFRIVGPERCRALEIVTRVVECLSAQIERAQVVVSLRIIGFSGNHLLERLFRLLEIATLEECHSVCKVIAVKYALVERSSERKGFSDAFGRILWKVINISQQMLGIEQPLIHLDDHSIFVNEKRGWQEEVPPAIEQIPIEDVVNARDIRRPEQ